MTLPIRIVTVNGFLSRLVVNIHFQTPAVTNSTSLYLVKNDFVLTTEERSLQSTWTVHNTQKA